MELDMTITKKLQTIADNEQKVYDAGKAKGIEEGKQAEYDAFWDGYLDNGNLRGCMQLFSGRGWNDNTFRPKYDIIAWGDMSSMFNNCGTLDLKQRLIDCGKTLRLTTATTNTLAFAYSGLTSVPRCNWMSASTLNGTYRESTKLVEIELVVHENLKYTNTFSNCTALTTLIIEGTIGQNGFDVHWSTQLSHDSLMSIINALKSGASNTITLGADNLAKLTDAEKAIATEKGWTLL